MNKRDYDILLSLHCAPAANQRKIAERCNVSLGSVNQSLRVLKEEGYLEKNLLLTAKAATLLEDRKPKTAIILAAGFGMRMVPINTDAPKGLLKVRGEVLIERLIRQLHEVGVRNIYIVVGYMKERFEYLIDTFGVKMIVNPEYGRKNNLHSIFLVRHYLTNSYVIPCDLWCAENPFSKHELYSWYMVSDASTPESRVRINRTNQLVTTDANGNRMIGISYLTSPEATEIRSRISELCSKPTFDSAFWEEALYNKDRICVYGKVVRDANVVEINTYEQLREIDAYSNNLKSDAISTIANALMVDKQEIENITVLKKGMTNRSFLFHIKGKKYIMRIPGEGTDKLINRSEEASVYTVLNGQNICDNVAYINPENGYKITEYMEGARVCDPENPEDVQRCMQKLRSFHEKKLTVEHTFDIFGQIQYYEDLWNGIPSDYLDYSVTKKQVLSLLPFIQVQNCEYCLTHIDAVPDNFLFVPAEGTEQIRLIDWEYAGMQDPHVDIAMFCVYAMYQREQVEALIDAYFPEGCSETNRAKIYCYIAACGLLWSNWCEYKRILGVEFGEYSLRQYRFAKEYYKIARAAIEKLTK